MKDLDIDTLEVGFDVPAVPGMDEAEIQTPCLILDLDALERNIRKMGDYAKAHGMRHRVHGKMHKSVDVAKLQETLGGSVGVCCQKVSEAQALVSAGTPMAGGGTTIVPPGKIQSSSPPASPPKARRRWRGAPTRRRSRSWRSPAAAAAAAAMAMMTAVAEAAVVVVLSRPRARMLHCSSNGLNVPSSEAMCWRCFFCC